MMQELNYLAEGNDTGLLELLTQPVYTLSTDVENTNNEQLLEDSFLLRD